MTTTDKRDSSTYRKLRRQLRDKAKRDNLPCHICGQPINFEAKGRAPLAFTADHIQSVEHGGRDHPENLAVSHVICNGRRGQYTSRGTPDDEATALAKADYQLHGYQTQAQRRDVRQKALQDVRSNRTLTTEDELTIAGNDPDIIVHADGSGWTLAGW